MKGLISLEIQISNPPRFEMLQGLLTICEILSAKEVSYSAREVTQKARLLGYISAFVILYSWTSSEEDGIAVMKGRISFWLRNAFTDLMLRKRLDFGGLQLE